MLSPDEGHFVVGSQANLFQPQGRFANVGIVLGPGVGVPAAQILFAQGDPIR